MSSEGAGEGFASNFGYGGLPGTTTGMAQGGSYGTGNPQIGAQGSYQQAALAKTGQLSPYQQQSGWSTAPARPKMTGIQVANLTPMQKLIQDSWEAVNPKFQDQIPATGSAANNFTSQFGSMFGQQDPNDPQQYSGNDYGGFFDLGNHLNTQNTGGLGFLGGKDTSQVPSNPNYNNPGVQNPGGFTGQPGLGIHSVTGGDQGMRSMAAPMGAQALGGMAPEQMRSMMQLQQQFGGGQQRPGGGQGGMQGQPPGATPPDRQRLMDHLANRGMNVRPGQRGRGGGPDPRMNGWGMGGNGLGLQGLMSRFA